MNIFNSATGFCTSTLYLAVPQLVLCSDTPKAIKCPECTCCCHHFKVETINEIVRSLYVLVLLLVSLLCLQVTSFHLASSENWAFGNPLSVFAAAFFWYFSSSYRLMNMQHPALLHWPHDTWFYFMSFFFLLEIAIKIAPVLLRVLMHTTASE